MSELDLALNKFGADLAIHLLGDIDDFGCLGCQEIVKKHKLAILEVVREMVGEKITWIDIYQEQPKMESGLAFSTEVAEGYERGHNQVIDDTNSNISKMEKE